MTDKQPRNIYQRFHAVMQQVSYVQKERKQGMKYSIVTHDAVTALVRPLFVEYGIVSAITEIDYRQDGNRTEAKLTVEFVNIDDPADKITVQCIGFGVDGQDKGPGKAVSYAYKYALLKTLGLETGDDPDKTQDAAAVHKPDQRLKDEMRVDTLLRQIAKLRDDGTSAGDLLGKMESAYGAPSAEWNDDLVAHARAELEKKLEQLQAEPASG